MIWLFGKKRNKIMFPFFIKIVTEFEQNGR